MTTLSHAAPPPLAFHPFKNLVNRLRGHSQRLEPPEALLRNNTSFTCLDQDDPLEQFEFAVVDCEMTGLDPKRHELISLAAVGLSGMRITPATHYASLVRPEHDVAKAGALAHRLTPGLLATAPSLEEALPGFIEAVAGKLIIGHHIGLDMLFLNRACRRLYGVPFHNPCIDTLRLAMVWREEQWKHHPEATMTGVSYTLTDLAAELGLPRFAAHDAMGDAMQTAYLFLYITRTLRRGGVHSLRDLFLLGRSWRWYF